MLSFEEIKKRKLTKVMTKAVVEMNNSGILATNIRYVGVKGDKIYNNFIDTVKNLSAEDQINLPDATIDFYNTAIEMPIDEAYEETDESIDPLEEEPEEEPEVDESEDEPEVDEPEDEPEDASLEELDFDDTTEQEEPEDPEVDEGVLEADDVDYEETPPNIPKEPEEAKVTKEKELNLDETPKTKRNWTKRSSTPLHTYVKEQILYVGFPLLKIDREFELPKVGNVLEYKKVRTIAMDFAKENGATDGQTAAISKVCNKAGYRLR